MLHIDKRGRCQVRDRPPMPRRRMPPGALGVAGVGGGGHPPSALSASSPLPTQPTPSKVFNALALTTNTLARTNLNELEVKRVGRKIEAEIESVMKVGGRGEGGGGGHWRGRGRGGGGGVGREIEAEIESVLKVVGGCKSFE
jgi:hypothetical protein